MITNTYTYGGSRTLTVERPEHTVYMRDRNVVKFVADSGDKFSYIDVELEYNGVTYADLHFEGLTENWFVVDLTDYFRDITPMLGIYISHINFEAEIEYNGSTDTVSNIGDTDGEYLLWDGRTLPDRSHCCERVVRYYADNSTELQLMYNDNDGFRYIDEFDVDTLSPDAEGTAYDVFAGGEVVDTFVRDSSSNVVRRIKMCCTPSHAVWLRFLNTDGCLRYVACKPVSIESKTDSLQYAVDGCERHKGSAYVTKATRTLTLGLADVDYAEYITDIRYADGVEFSYDYAGDWMPCILDSMTYKEDGGSHNATIKVIVNI